MTIEIFILWYVTLVYYFLRIVDTWSERIALVVIVLFGPLCFPISIIGGIYIKEREKWRVNAWYRDNWPPKEYEIIGMEPRHEIRIPQRPLGWLEVYE